MTSPSWAPRNTQSWIWKYDAETCTWTATNIPQQERFDLTGVPPHESVILDYNSHATTLTLEGDNRHRTGLTLTGRLPKEISVEITSLILDIDFSRYPIQEGTPPSSTEPAKFEIIAKRPGLRAYLALRSLIKVGISIQAQDIPAIDVVRATGPGVLFIKSPVGILRAEPPAKGEAPVEICIIHDLAADPPQFGRVGYCRGTFGLVTHGPATVIGNHRQPPKLSGLRVEVPGSNKQKQRSQGPIITGVDPTELPAHTLESGVPETFRFEPAPKALRRWAKRSAPWRALLGGAKDSFKLNHDAEWISRFNALILKRSISGSTDTSARWAAARLHHAAAAPFERLLRLPLWMLGYNARPGPPLLTWLIVSELIAVAYLKTTAGSPALASLLSAPLLPLAALTRLGTDSGILPQLAGVWRLLATLAIAAPLTSALIALRRLLRVPASDHSQ